MTMRIAPLVLVALALAIALPTAGNAMAAADDPAISTIDGLDSSLLDAMKSAKSAGVQARYRKLLPAVDRAFDLPTMMRFAVGPSWASYSVIDQSALIKAFSRLSAANLAHNFSGFSGEQFKINPTVQTRGPDKLVRTQIIPTSGDPTDLNYRMRQSGGSWKVIDVYFGAISQLTAQRSDFAATVNAGGAAALVQSIDAQTAKLLKD